MIVGKISPADGFSWFRLYIDLNQLHYSPSAFVPLYNLMEIRAVPVPRSPQVDVAGQIINLRIGFPRSRAVEQEVHCYELHSLF